MPHSIEIFRRGSLYTTVKPDDSSQQVKAVMGDNNIVLTFVLSFEAKFQINDYCTAFGETYVICENPPPVNKVSKYEFRYTVTFNSLASQLKKIQYLFLGDDNTLREPEFPLMGNAQTFMDLLFMNIDRFVNGINSGLAYPNPFLDGWSQGETILTEYKLISFSSDNCLSALSKIAEAFNTEWWIEDKTIMLTKKVNDTGKTLKHGRSKGLYEIQRLASDNSKIITSIYPYGSTKNIPGDYGSQRLRITALGGTSVNRNTELYGVIEQTVIFEDIYPHRTGKVTGVDSTNVFKFIDSTMDFNLNSFRLPGLSAKVVFNTGQLSGYQFEVSNYNNSTKEITILKNKDETALDIPSNDLKPDIGDEYVFVDIKLPGEYVSKAETDLLSAAGGYLIENADPRYSFSITLDPAFVKNKNYTFQIGDLIWLTDNDLQIDKKIRVVNISRNIVNENQYTLTLSDVVPQTTIQAINADISSTQQNVARVSSQLQNNALFNGRMIVPTTNDVTGMFPLYVDNTGKVFRKI